jgi:hypothetical protein
MRRLLVIGACFVCAGAVLISLAGGIPRVAGLVLVIWGLGTVPVALRLRREGSR